MPSVKTKFLLHSISRARTTGNNVLKCVCQLTCIKTAQVSTELWWYENLSFTDNELKIWNLQIIGTKSDWGVSVHSGYPLKLLISCSEYNTVITASEKSRGSKH